MYMVNGPSQLGDRTYYRIDKIEEEMPGPLEMLRYPFAIVKDFEMAEKIAVFLNEEDKKGK